MNRAEEKASEGVTLYKFKWKWSFDMADGTMTLKRQEPAPTKVTGSQTTTKAVTNQQQDSTSLPPIRITKKTKRLIPEGDYEALAVKGSHRRNQYRRWEAVLEFVLEAPAPAGAPLVLRVGMGYEAEPELAADHWFGRILEKFGTTDVSKLVGWRFLVTVKTVKKEHTDKYDRPPDEWYSTVRRAIFWDDHVLACKRLDSREI